MASSTATPAAIPGGASASVAERRLVSVLFVDLVGFTTLSESRDPEEVRDLLTRYFDTSRTLIARYGGTVEKFIGDAVMAVGGTPVAQEDDAERAVRAALELMTAVAALGQEMGARDLAARAGVLTGEAAVTIGAEGQGMVAGDLVNTASRIQAAAPAGSVYVGEATKRLTEAAVVYEDAGLHELKGKAEPIRLWHGLRVVAGVRGAMKSSGLEAPFVGRARELGLIKQLFHASADEKRDHLVSVVGIGGIGKSRLSWEFFKYIDGVAFSVRWHRGRCLPYGEGVTYWALAEMVRTRAGIVEGEEPSSALAKLRQAVEETVPDIEERRWIEPRLANLLGLEEATGRDQEGLFAAWRLFYERLSEEMPTVLVFEDLQWADASLLDFIDYMLEWSRDHPLFILTLGRPEIMDRRPTWGAGRRNFTSLFLEPLALGAMEDLLAGLVPGLPEELRKRILERAEGVPLYAVETVRMLLDRGLLAQEQSVYRPTGPIETLEVPETLHALIAARLDGLTPDERRLVQDASVLGKTFTKGGIAALTAFSESDLDSLLSSLIRKEVLYLQADARSPERGQYGFLQDLLKRVAYDTLSKKERKAKHLAAARFIEESWGRDEEEFVEIVAAHYQEAYRAAPDAADAREIMGKTRDLLLRAGERAASLAAPNEAQRYFDEAADLTEDAVTKAELFERAGTAARAGGDADAAITRFERAIALFDGQGKTHPAARVSARLGEAMWDRGRFAEAVDRMDQSFKILSAEEPDGDFALLAAQLGRMEFFAGRIGVAEERIETAIDVAEGLWLPEVLSHALNTLAVILYSSRGRRRQGYALLKYALEVALENDIPSAALRAYYNLSDLATQNDRYQEGREFVDRGLALARRLGNRDWEWRFLSQVYAHFVSGQWDAALAMVDEIPIEKVAEARLAGAAFLLFVPLIRCHRGEVKEAEKAFSVFPEVESSADVQEVATHAAGRAALHLAKGEAPEALRAAREALSYWDAVGPGSEQIKEALLAGVEAAFRLEDLQTVEDLLGLIERIPRGKLPQFLEASAMRVGARLAAARRDSDAAERQFKGAAGLFREIAAPFHMAVTLLEYGEWLASRQEGLDPDPFLLEAREIFEQLEAKPWVERLDKARGSVERVS